MCTIEDVELDYLAGVQILHDPEWDQDPVLVFSTDAGDMHFRVTHDMLLRLSTAFQKYAEKTAEAEAAA